MARMKSKAEGSNIIYARGYPYGAPLKMLRGAGTYHAREYLKGHKFRWNPERRAWETYMATEDFIPILLALKAQGYNVKPKEDTNYPPYDLDKAQEEVAQGLPISCAKIDGYDEKSEKAAAATKRAMKASYTPSNAKKDANGNVIVAQPPKTKRGRRWATSKGAAVVTAAVNDSIARGAEPIVEISSGLEFTDDHHVAPCGGPIIILDGIKKCSKCLAVNPVSA